MHCSSTCRQVSVGSGSGQSARTVGADSEITMGNGQLGRGQQWLAADTGQHTLGSRQRGSRHRAADTGQHTVGSR
jgi:hypothetical protein